MSRIFDNRELSAAAKKLRDAEELYEKVWTNVRANHGERLDPDTFWEIMDLFVTILKQRLTMKHFGESNASKQAADELFRQWAVGDLEVVDIGGGDTQGITFDQLLGFAHTWDELSSELHRILFDIVTDKGDDSYGDLCDSLPLAGRAVVRQLLEPAEWTIHGNNDIKRILPEELAHYIWDGENYFGMMLGDAAKRWFKIESRDRKPRKDVFV